MKKLSCLLVFFLAALDVARTYVDNTCFQCDGIREGGGLCLEGGLGNIGRQVKCGRLSCGLVREERQILSSATNAVLSSSYRWRRDCVRNAKTLVMNSGIEEEDLDYRDTGEPGCQYLQEFVYENGDSRTSTKTKFTLCFCNTPLCNTVPRHMGGKASTLEIQSILTLLTVLFLVLS